MKDMYKYYVTCTYESSVQSLCIPSKVFLDNESCIPAWFIGVYFHNIIILQIHIILILFLIQWRKSSLTK